MTPFALESPYMSDVIRSNRPQIAALVLFSIIAVLVATDLIIDYQSGTSVLHIIFEGGIFISALAGATAMGYRLVNDRKTAREQARKMSVELETTRKDAERWRQEAEQYLRGLGVAIERQFDRWELTPAEKEVALLLLKGLSHREIAEVRGVAERTARQQAYEMYKKADLGGRADLSAFFLEDLLLAPPDSDGNPG